MSKPRCFFAFRSPYSRLGLHKLQRAGIECDLIPFTGPPDGAPFFDPVTSKPKLAYYAADVARMSARMGLEVTLPKPFDVDFTPANTVFFAMDRLGLGMAFALAASEARWARGADLSDVDILEACAREAGATAPVSELMLDDAALKNAVVRARAMVVEDGVFGVPFVSWNGQQYWGQDRMDLFLEEYAAPATA